MSRCKCFADTLQLVTDNLKEQLPSEEAATLKTEWQGAMLVFEENGIKSKMGMPVAYEYQKFKKSGEPHRNMTKGTTSLLMIYCPLCGGILKPDEQEQSA